MSDPNYPTGFVGHARDLSGNIKSADLSSQTVMIDAQTPLNERSQIFITDILITVAAGTAAGSIRIFASNNAAKVDTKNFDILAAHYGGAASVEPTIISVSYPMHKRVYPTDNGTNDRVIVLSSGAHEMTVSWSAYAVPL